MYRNSERFLTAFNRIEKKLRAIINNGRNLGFSKMVRMLKHRDAIVGRYSDDLLEFAELRNAIVHNKVEMAHVIAEPHDSVVVRIELIEKELLEPRKVNPEFIKKVFYFEQNEPLSNLLEAVHEKRLTKFPVYHKKEFKGLLSQRAITYWLARNMHTEYTFPGDTKVGEVLKYEKKDNYRFIAENLSVIEAAEIFGNQYARGNRLEALLITKNGNSSEKLKGIVTNFDVIGIK